MPTLQNIEGYEKIVYENRLAKLSPPKPSINFFNGEMLYLSHNIALARSKELLAYWKLNNPTAPDWIDTFQEKAVVEMLALFLRGKNFQLISGTGTGKTFMMFALIDILIYYGYLEQVVAHELASCQFPIVAPFPIVMFTPPSVVEQSNSVKKLFPNIKEKCIVTNYETLRTKKGLGQIWIEWKSVYDSSNNEVDIVPEWRKEFAPYICFFDENQKLKNNGTTQTKLCQEYSTLENLRNVRSIFASASPFTKPSESKTVVTSLKPYLDIDVLGSVYGKRKGDGLEEVLDNVVTKDQLELELNRNLPRVNSNNFKHWLDNYVCTAPNTNEFSYSPANMERLTDCLSTEHHIVLVNEVKFKHKTMNKHVLLDLNSTKAKIYAAAYDNYLKELIKAQQEPPKSRLIQIWIAQTKFRKMAEFLRCDDLATLALEAERKGKSVIIASAYVESQDELLRILTEDCKFPREKISLIRGGQTKNQRWKEINRFQDEESTICLLMIQAGGVGLSLHNYKPRNKRPRFVLMPPVWSIFDMVQVLGRAHRINSETTTHQWVVWYRGTIEEDVCERLKDKSLSMRELMRRKESWSELFVDESLRNNFKKEDKEQMFLIEEKNAMDTSSRLTKVDDDDNDNNEDEEKDFFNVDEEIMTENMEQDDSSGMVITE